jgi:eukaryotic-like serine/threonine-protein kinase
LEAGKEIGPYRLLFRLGRGGMGEVWAAERAGSAGFSKFVALKLLEAPSFEKTSVVMFVDEAKASAALSHPAIVPTTDFGSDGALVYIAMELVRGPSLNQLIGRLAQGQQRMPPALVCHIGERIASALDHGYRALKLVHRDVSPQNILIDRSGIVRLADFGIAQTAIQEHRTNTGVFRGKPGYLSPEQILGRHLDDKSDLFALGVVLYECAASARLFGRETIEDSMDAALHDVPVSLAARVPGFPDPLWRAISRSLEKEPARRARSAAELASELTEIGKTLPGWTTTSRDLGELVARLFPEAELDIDSKIRDALLGFEETAASKTRTVTERQSERFLDEPPPAPMRPWVLGSGIAIALAGAAMWMGTRETIEPAPALEVIEPAKPPPITVRAKTAVEPDAGVVVEIPRPPPPPKRAPIPIAIDAGVVVKVDPKVRVRAVIRRLELIDPKAAGRHKAAYAEVVASGDEAKLEAFAAELERELSDRIPPDRP